MRRVLFESTHRPSAIGVPRGLSWNGIAAMESCGVAARPRGLKSAHLRPGVPTCSSLVVARGDTIAFDMILRLYGPLSIVLAPLLTLLTTAACGGGVEEPGKGGGGSAASGTPGAGGDQQVSTGANDSTASSSTGSAGDFECDPYIKEGDGCEQQGVKCSTAGGDCGPSTYRCDAGAWALESTGRSDCAPSPPKSGDFCDALCSPATCTYTIETACGTKEVTAQCNSSSYGEWQVPDPCAP